MKRRRLFGLFGAAAAGAALAPLAAGVVGDTPRVAEAAAPQKTLVPAQITAGPRPSVDAEAYRALVEQRLMTRADFEREVFGYELTSQPPAIERLHQMLSAQLELCQERGCELSWDLTGERATDDDDLLGDVVEGWPWVRHAVPFGTVAQLYVHPDKDGTLATVREWLAFHHEPSAVTLAAHRHVVGNVTHDMSHTHALTPMGGHTHEVELHGHTPDGWVEVSDRYDLVIQNQGTGYHYRVYNPDGSVKTVLPSVNVGGPPTPLMGNLPFGSAPVLGSIDGLRYEPDMDEQA